MVDFLSKLQSLSLTEDNVDFIKRITNFYSDLDANERETLRSMVYQYQQNLKLLSLSEQIAETSLNSNNRSFLRFALLLHSIEGFRWDFRENYIYLSMINYAYNYFNYDVNEDLNFIRLLSSEATNQYIENFFNRPQNLRSLKALGLAIDKINGLVRFEAIKPPWA